SLLTAYFDLDFYVEYIDFLDFSYIQDQRLFFYSTVETSTLNDINLKIINTRLFTYIDSFLISPLEQNKKYHVELMLKSFEKKDFKYKPGDDLYDVDRFLDYEMLYQNLENKVITSEELPWHQNLEI